MARILVVDDQPQILMMLEAMLNQDGHIVTCARDSFDAIEKVKRQPFEMVITDVMMPGGASGFDLVKTLRADPDLKAILIVLLTGKREKKDVDRGIQAGADDYAIKPVDPDLFLAKVNALLLKRFKGTVTFNESLTSEPAIFTNSLTIVGVSEIGMTINSTQPFHAGSKIKIETSIFTKVGIEAPILRVLDCVSIPSGEHFIVRAQFIGLSEASLQPLRVWIRGQKVNRAG